MARGTHKTVTLDDMMMLTYGVWDTQNGDIRKWNNKNNKNGKTIF